MMTGEQARYARAAKYHAEYSSLAARYRVRSFRADAPRSVQFPKIDQAAFALQKQKNIRIYGYTNRLTSQFVDYMERSPAVFALFSHDGCLLKLYGREESIASLREDGIERGTYWSLEASGRNAVTLGLLAHQTTGSIGDENDSPFLKKYAIYFSPVMVADDLRKNGEHQFYGGVAILVPVDAHSQDHYFTVIALSNDLILHINSGDMYYRLLENSTDAMVALDTTNSDRQITTLYHSSTLFELLGIEPADIYFRPAEQLFDPLPANKQLWSIVWEHRRVSDMETVLSVRGKEVPCSVTSLPYDQPYLGAKGVILLITTPTRISTHAAKKIGNSAVRTFDDIVGVSRPFRSAVQRARLISNSNSNVLILGESGAGKDIFAQAIHCAGARKNKPFVAVNCGALPRDLISSELFGYDGGAFTGAKKQGNIGKFELANGGTLFLDEIGELPFDTQATLLRAVEQKRFTRVGGNHEIDVDIRIISATNVDIMSLIDKKLFRLDLYYRLSTLCLEIPPLRERKEDIIPLAEYFIQEICRRIGCSDPITLSEGAKQLLLSMPWQGNIRELQNMIEEIVQLFPSTVISAEQIRESSRSPRADAYIQPAQHQTATIAGNRGRKVTLTREDIEDALRICGGNRSKAAAYLGIARRTLYTKMEQFGME